MLGTLSLSKGSLLIETMGNQAEFDGAELDETALMCAPNAVFRKWLPHLAQRFELHRAQLDTATMERRRPSVFSHANSDPYSELGRSCPRWFDETTSGGSVSCARTGVQSASGVSAGCD